ncbi:conjugal transfer protein TraE [Pantoea agglomerans]
MHSMTKILGSLLTGGQERAIKQMAEEDDGRKEVTSIRLRPQTRAWLQAQSETLGISVSQMINIMVDGVISIETSPRQSRIDTMYDRLMLLFESHGLAPLEMSRMLAQYGITLSALKSRNATLDLITPELINDVSGWFGVNASWLSATTDEVYPRRGLGWYKKAEDMAVSVIERNILHGNLDVYVIRSDGVSFQKAEHQEDNTHNLNIGFVLKYRVTVGDVSFNRFEFSEFQRWNHAACREDLKHLFRFTGELSRRHRDVQLHGRTLKEDFFDRISAGRILPLQLEEALNRSGWWDPNEFAAEAGSVYKEKKFSRYLDAYFSALSRTFVPIRSEHSRSPEGWMVRTWKEGEEPIKYFSLADALDDVYDRHQGTP